MKAAYLSSLHLRICTSSRKPSSVSGLLTLMLNHLPKKQPGSSDCITLMSITKANSLPCWVSIWTTSLLSWPTYMHIHSRLNVFMKPWPATVITITKYKCPPPPFFFLFTSYKTCPSVSWPALCNSQRARMRSLWNFVSTTLQITRQPIGADLWQRETCQWCLLKMLVSRAHSTYPLRIHKTTNTITLSWSCHNNRGFAERRFSNT